MAVQAASYQLILDRQVGQNKLHDKVRIVSAGNMIDDGAAVTGEMSTALQSRMAHINIELSFDDWLDWAMSSNVHQSITSFIKFKPTSLYQFDPKTAADTYPCPRTWSMVNSIVANVGINNPQIQNLVSAVISDGAACDYINYCKNFVNLPTYEAIIADPLNVDIPKEMSTLYALSGSIGSQVTAQTIDPIMQYIGRMPQEFQLSTFHDFTKRDGKLVTLAPVRAWLVANAKHLLGK